MTVAEILSKAGESETEALQEHAMLLCMSKISRFEAECGQFQAKYGKPFETFRNQLHNVREEEDFEVEDDLMDWEYAHSALAWWRERIEEVSHAC